MDSATCTVFSGALLLAGGLGRFGEFASSKEPGSLNARGRSSIQFAMAI